MNSEQKYAKPPIVEAVIDFQLRAEIGDPTLEKMKNLLKASFPSVEQGLRLELAIGRPEVGLSQSSAGYKLSSVDGLDVVLIGRQAITNSRLAPYEGWSALEERTKKVWDKMAKFIGIRDVRRIGVRYINRLDIPGSSVNPYEWVQMGIKLPSTIPTELSEFGLRVVSKTDKIGTILACGSVPSPLLDHQSINLDIDVFIDEPLPQREDEFWQSLVALRRRKNDVFESSITERMREQFGLIT